MNRLPMNPHVQDILRHGYLWLFLAALLERIGLPLLVTPLVIAAGAVAGLGDLSLLGIILVTVLASETGDLIWYELGRNRGPSVLRQRFIRSLRVSRMTVDELKAAIDRGERPFVVDLRHKLEFLVNPRTVSSAVRISPDELSLRHAEIPRDREVVLYCTCPSEATSAKVAMELKKIGITRVRPLMGGLQAWENQGYPIDDFYHEEEAKAVS